MFEPRSIARLFLAASLLFCASAFAAAPAGFDAANALYDKGDFAGARSVYETLVKSGDWSAHLFYNLANAAYRQGDKGAAFLGYERALELEPTHPEAAANLAFLRGETGAKLPAVPWYARALSWPPAKAALWIAAGAFWGLCFSWIPLLWKRRAAALPALFCGLLLAWSGTVVGWQSSQGELWIVTADAAKAQTMPAENSPTAATLPMGSHVQLLLERGAWLYAQLPDGTRGWISRDAVAPVRLTKAKYVAAEDADMRGFHTDS